MCIISRQRRSLGWEELVQRLWRERGVRSKSFVFPTFWLPFIYRLIFPSPSTYSPDDDRAATQKALQTVAAGQQAENLLDFDDEPSTLDGGLGSQPTGLAATQVEALAATPAAANLLAGTSSNPLDDLVSIFGSSGIGSTPSPAPANGINGAMGGMGIMSPVSLGQSQVNGVVSPTVGPGQGAQEDLLGLF